MHLNFGLSTKETIRETWDTQEMRIRTGDEKKYCEGIGY
jgi:hypothetical protein